MTVPCRSGALTEELTRERDKDPLALSLSARAVLAVSEQPLLLITLSHEHIQSVTILPDHGVLAGVPDGSTSKQGMRQHSDSPIQRASVER